MSHTNQTQHYQLPQFVGTDVPGWLTDVNQGYQKIDNAIHSADAAATSASQSAGQAVNDVQALNQTVSTQATQIAAAASAASAAQTSANAADAKAQQALDAIGSGEPVIVSVTAANWSLDSATGRYKKTIQAVNVSGAFPSIGICGATLAAVPTDEQIADYGKLVCVKADTTNNTLDLYAKEIPSAAFYMQVTGVTIA